MKYNRFFNLHIPKTGGTYFRENILNPLVPYLNENGISTNPYGEGGEKDYAKTGTYHWCWYEPFVQEESYIFTTLRDPVKRLISHYAWQATRAVYYEISDYKIEDITVDNFYKWLDLYSDIYKNFQSKNLVYYNPNHSIYMEAVHRGWKSDGVPEIESFLFSKDFADFKIDKDALLANINRIDMMLKAEDLRDLDKQLIVRDRIMSDLGLDGQQTPIKNDVYGNENAISQELYSKFTNKQIADLYSFNDIDSEIYFNDSLFFKP